MEHMNVFGLLLVVLGLVIASPLPQQDEKLMFREDGAADSNVCPAEQHFSLFFKGCKDLPGVLAVNDKCPNGNLPYTYLGVMRCIAMPEGADISGKCPSGEYYSISFMRCLDLAGMTPVDGKCSEDDTSYTYHGATKCYPMTHSVSECPKGQYYNDQPDTMACQDLPGPLGDNETCHEDDITYTYNGETRCYEMMHVL